MKSSQRSPLTDSIARTTSANGSSLRQARAFVSPPRTLGNLPAQVLDKRRPADGQSRRQPCEDTFHDALTHVVLKVATIIGLRINALLLPACHQCLSQVSQSGLDAYPAYA